MPLYGAHHGYVYQDLATACFFVDALIKNYEKLTIDRKFSKIDKFDDLTIQEGDFWTRKQFKHSTSKKLELKDLKNGEIRLDNLILSHIRFPNKTRSQYRLCLAWSASDNSETLKILKPVDNVLSFQNLNTSCYVLKPEIIWPENSGPIWDELITENFNREDFLNFSERFVIEVNWPSASLDLNSPGVLENLLTYLLTERIGIGRYPNENRDPIDVASRLIRLAYLCRSKGKTIDTNEIISQLQLRTDFGQVAQKFPVEKDKFVYRKSFQEELRNNVLNNPITILTGPPGSGKSWCLTKLAEELSGSGIIVAKHYCYLEPGDEMVQKRITSNAFFGNLIAELINTKPELKYAKYTLYSADADELERILTEAVSTFNSQVVLIIDGLDHISRVFEESKSLTLMDIDIIERLVNLRIPEGVHLVIGSQPGSHIKPLHDCYSIKNINVPLWDFDDTKALSDRLGLSSILNSHFDDLNRIIVQLHERSEGNPLYATFLARELIAQIDRGIAFDIYEFLTESPEIHGDISCYYAHVTKTTQSEMAPIVAEIIGLVDFAVTEQDLKEIHPSLAHHIPQAIEILRPILIDVTGQGGIRIYHESFRRYIKNKLNQDNVPFSNILSPVIHWLMNRGFFNDAKSYRFLLSLLRRAGRDSEILVLVNGSFVSDSVEAGHSRSAIQANLILATEVATQKLDWASLARIAELNRSVYTCFEEKLLDIVRFGRAFASVFGAEALSNRLLFDGKPTLSAKQGLLLCSFCDDAGIVPPWREYLDLLEKDDYHSHQTERENDVDDAVSIAAFHGRIRMDGIKIMLERLTNWLKSLENTPDWGYLRSLFSRIIKFGEESYLESILTEPSIIPIVKQILRITLITSLVQSGNSNKAMQIIESAIKENLPLKEVLHYFRLGLKPIIKPDLPDHTKINISIEKDAISPRYEAMSEWVQCINLFAFLDPSKLESEKERVKGEGWYRAWLNFVINLSESEVKSYSDPLSAESGIVEALCLLERDTHPFVGNPRACDLYSIRSVIHESFERALLLLTTRSGWESAIRSLEKISKETTSYLQNSPSGPLTSQSFIDLLLPYASKEGIGDLVISAIERQVNLTEQVGQYYEIHAEHEMVLIEALSRSGKNEEALKHWKRAAIFLTSYGFRRDVTIYELLDCISSIAILSQTKAKEALQRVQPLVNCVVKHTDGKETKHAHNKWFSELCSVDIAHALRLLARSLTVEGGIIDWRIEEGIQQALNIARNVSPPDLILSVEYTQPFNPDKYGRPSNEENKRVEACLKDIEKIYAYQGRSRASEEFKKLVVHAIDDVTVPSEAIYKQVKSFAEKRDFGFPKKMSFVSTDERPKEDTISQLSLSAIINKQFPHHLFLHNTTPYQILSTLMKKVDYSIEFEVPINSFGYKLIELLQEGHQQQVYQLIDAYARYLNNRYYSSKPLETLTILADGLERHGFAKEAAFVLTLIYSRSRGGGGYKHLGGSECHNVLDRAMSLSKDLAFEQLGKEISRFIESGYVIGITSHLVELFAHFKELNISMSIWNAAYDVIAHRLSGYEIADGPFLSISEIEPPSSVEIGLTELLFARVSHPELCRKRSALVGAVQLMINNPVLAAEGLKEACRINTPLTSLVSLLLALLETPPASLPAIKKIADELQSFTQCNHFGLKYLAKSLLEKANVEIVQPSRNFLNKPELSNSLTLKDEGAILSLDTKERIKRIETFWTEFPSLVARRFQYIWEKSNYHKERARSRHKSSQSVRQSFPSTRLLFWENEIFETAINEIFTEYKEILWFRGEWSDEAESALAQIMLPSLKMHIAIEESRILRPNILKPRELQNSISTLEPIKDEGIFNNWYRIAIYEKELLCDDSVLGEVEGIQITYAGVVSELFKKDMEKCLPLGVGEYDMWWKENSHMESTIIKNFTGRLVGFDWIEDYLGTIPVLMLPDRITSHLSLKSDSWPGPLQLIDEAGNIAAVFRWWHTSPLGTDIDRESPRLTGCQLLVRPDIFDKIESLFAYPFKFVTHIRRVNE